MSDADVAARHAAAIAEFRKKLLAHRARLWGRGPRLPWPLRPRIAKWLLTFKRRAQELEAKVRSLREELKGNKATFEKTEDDLKALQSVGQIIGEVLRQLDEERCEFNCRKSPCASIGVHLTPACILLCTQSL